MTSPGGGGRHPVTRQPTADDGEIARLERLDMVTDQRDARGVADEMDLVLVGGCSRRCVPRVSRRSARGSSRPHR